MTAPGLLFARYLRQRQELGETELVLDAPATERVRALGTVGQTGIPDTAPDVAESAATRIGSAPRAADAPALVTLGSRAAACSSCGLSATRTSVVFGEGDPDADLVVVGEAPGEEEDRSGRPFVGRAGKLLDLLLLSIGLPRERVYICNVLKCRPPRNRNPHPEEVEACSSFLRGQISAVRPKAILAVGASSAQSLLQTSETIGQLRGKVHSFEGTPLVPTYHPAALLRNPGWKRPVWEDLQRLRRLLDD